MSASDVTALVLSIGEKTVGRALASLRCQTRPPAEVVSIENVTPFYKAVNTGVAQVHTKYFVQVDADMIPDRRCLELMRDAMAPQIGTAVGRLRDPLIGIVVGIKLYRTECFAEAGFPDSISPDTDFRRRMVRQGWRVVYPLYYHRSRDKAPHTFGQHRPDYTPLYTYSKFRLAGQRYRYRRTLSNLRSLFWRIGNNGHPAALIAQVAMAHGVFLKANDDGLKPFEEDSGFERIRELLAGEGEIIECGWTRMLSQPLPALFADSLRLGAEIHRRRSPQTLRRCLGELEKAPQAEGWVAALGLCHGLFDDDLDASADWESLAALLEP